jgi:hypothetical protein
MEMIKRYLNDLKVHTENSNSPYDTFRKDMDYTNHLQEKYKIKREVVSNFNEQGFCTLKTYSEIDGSYILDEYTTRLDLAAYGLLKETPQDRWQKKAGYISKSYKLKKELVDEFKEACDKAGKSQAEVLTELMSEFIGRSNG